MSLAEEIRKKQQELVILAAEKDNVLSDPDVYRCSCVIDEMIVKFMKNSLPSSKSGSWHQ